MALQQRLNESEPLRNRSRRSPAGRRLRKTPLCQARRMTGFDGEMMDVIALYASGPPSGRQTVRQDRARCASRGKKEKNGGGGRGGGEKKNAITLLLVTLR